MTGLALLLALQAGGTWTAAPSGPTVGDTIQLERALTTPAGWRVRAGKLASGTTAEPLGDAVVLASSDGWVIRYAVVAWTPGDISLDMPPLWRLGPDGTADSLAGGTAVVHVASVIPDSIKNPLPQPALGPLRLDRASPIPVIAAVLLAGGALLLFIFWRRRGPRTIPAADTLSADDAVSDTRWLAAGEPKAVAARAAQGLRRALAQAIPEAHEALSTEECLATIAQVRPDAPLRDLRDLLHALDQVAFATAYGIEVGPLAARARTLARELSRSGNGAGAGTHP